MKGEASTQGLWSYETSIFSAISHYLEINITFDSLEQHFDIINNKSVYEWKVEDKCWRIVTHFLDSDEYVSDYTVSMYLLDWKSRPYIYDYCLTDEMATDRLHFLVRIDKDANTWDIEEMTDPTKFLNFHSKSFILLL